MKGSEGGYFEDERKNRPGVGGKGFSLKENDVRGERGAEPTFG